MKNSIFIFLFMVLFQSCGADNEQNNSKNSASLVKAVQNSDVEAVIELLKAGNDVETRDDRNRTLLLIATYDYNVEMAKILLDAGASVNEQDDMKDSPFLYAGAEGKLELVKLYLQHNPDFNLYNRFGGTALIPAAEKGHPEVVRLLANTPGYPIDHVNNLGWTALMEAVLLGNGSDVYVRIVEELVNAGVNINIPDSRGVTALEYAQNRGYSEIVTILENALRE